VFALGGKSSSDDASETSYYAIRAALARTVSEAASFIAERGLAAEGAPPIVRFIAQIAGASHRGVRESRGRDRAHRRRCRGAAVNLMFLDYFQKVAMVISPCDAWNASTARSCGRAL